MPIRPTSRSSTLKTLQSYGYEGTLSEFRDVLAVTLHNLCPNWTAETMSRNPRTALVFCDMIRAAIHPKLPDDVIMGALLNTRRHAVDY